jgi:hypothetical protein
MPYLKHAAVPCSACCALGGRLRPAVQHRRHPAQLCYRTPCCLTDSCCFPMLAVQVGARPVKGEEKHKPNPLRCLTQSPSRTPQILADFGPASRNFVYAQRLYVTTVLQTPSS